MGVIGEGVWVGVSIGITVVVELGGILATDEGAGSSEHPARSMATGITLAPSQLVMDIDIAASVATS